MTAASAPAGHGSRPGSRAAAVPWRQLIRVTVRQHRTALLCAAAAVAVLALTLLASGLPLHQLAARRGWLGATRASVDYGGWVRAWLALILQLLPVLAGVFIGAPLVPREIERGTARLAWTQAASRPRWLLGQVLPLAVLLALAGLGLGAAFGWWQAPFPDVDSIYGGPWSPMLFSLSPLLLAGWAVFAFALGVLLGTAFRRMLPAMAVTLAGYGALWYAVAHSWRMHYLAPLRRSFAVTYSADGSYGWSASYRGNQQPVLMSQQLGFRDGRLLTSAQQAQPVTWLRAHHIVIWETYQPASRYHAIQLIEFGWLLAAAALLVAAAVLLIRRRRA